MEEDVDDGGWRLGAWDNDVKEASKLHQMDWARERGKDHAG